MAILNNTAINMGYICLFGLVFLFPLGIHPEVEILDHRVLLVLGFGGTSILSPTVAAPIYILTNSA